MDLRPQSWICWKAYSKQTNHEVNVPFESIFKFNLKTKLIAKTSKVNAALI